MRNLIYILLVIISPVLKGQDLFSVSGTVRDEKGETLPGATVFITNSRYITLTDAAGRFSLGSIPPGSYEVVIKMLGFIPATQNISIQKNPVNLLVSLREDILLLKPVVISTGPSPNRTRYVEQFIKTFIGESVNARQCRLLNPQALNFHFDKDKNIMKVQADEFLEIENLALGYKLKYLLTEYEADFNSGISAIAGFPYFEELKGTAAEQRQWEKNRRVAYLNSSRHFFRAVASGSAGSEGFLAYSFADKVSKTAQPASRPLSIDSMFVRDKNFKVLSSRPEARSSDTIRSAYYIVYTGGTEPALYKRTGLSVKLPVKLPSRQAQVSILEPLSDEIRIDQNGELPSGRSFKFGGYWAWSEGIANLTPIDYFISPPGTNNSPAREIRDTVLRSTMAAIDSTRMRFPVEKLYLQTDKPYYTTGDTIWFKSYLFDAAYLQGSVRSGLLYVELANDSNSVIKRVMTPVINGISQGSIALPNKEIPQGSYTLRAYTNWMQNFGEDYIFKKNFYIGSAAPGSWLVNTRTRVEKEQVEMALQFNQLTKEPVGLRDIQLRVMEGRRALSRNNVQTAADGRLDVNFSLPQKSDPANITIIAEDLQKGAESRMIAIPVSLNRPEYRDLQFLPEGGSLVAGIPCRIGFKAIAEDGKGTEISGKIYDSRSKEITSFSALHKGMGALEITPEAGQAYTAQVALPDGTVKTYPLPEVRPSGTSLKVSSSKESDSLKVMISATPGLAGTYYLIGQSRGVVCYAAVIRFRQGAAEEKKIAKSLFPTGIAQLTLLNADKQPLNERIIFIDHQDNLKIAVTSGKPAYTLRDSISLTLSVTGQDGQPAEGNFSLSVTDDSQVKADSSQNNILATILLSSDLKGTIEEPGWYFRQDKNDEQRTEALDNLLLIQGWTGYEWKGLISPAKTEPAYAAESEFSIQGRVINIFNKPVERSGVTLLQMKPLLVLDTLTNENGRFMFRSPYLSAADTTSFMLQAKNRNDKSFNIDIKVDEFKPLVFQAPTERLHPWYLNSDTTLLRNISTKIIQQEAFQPGGTMLREVTITAAKTVKGSKNLNGPGGADIVLDQEDMKKAKKMTLFELLKERFEWFYKIGVGDKSIYVLNGRTVSFVIDGISDNISVDMFMHYLTAEDIRGIEIIYSNKYGLVYNENIRYQKMIILEITTYSGNGAFYKKTPGTYIYRPVPFSPNRQFYRPKYTVNADKAPGTDLRSTIHWEPNVFTDASGKAQVSFYSADRPGSYTVIIEGTDMDGRIGYQRGKIVIAPH